MYLDRELEDSTSQVHHSRQTVKNAGRGFAPETQDEDIVDEVFGRRCLLLMVIIAMMLVTIYMPLLYLHIWLLIAVCQNPR